MVYYLERFVRSRENWAKILIHKDNLTPAWLAALEMENLSFDGMKAGIPLILVNAPIITSHDGKRDIDFNARHPPGFRAITGVFWRGNALP